MKHIAVIDVGKTNVKVAIVELEFLEEKHVLSIPNISIRSGHFLTFNTESIWDFICESLKELSSKFKIDGISVTTHGAAAVLIMEDGTYAGPIDYEDSKIDAIAAEYSKIRPNFEETGSPHLAGGLNIGSQLYCQFTQVPALRERLLYIITYPQFWGWKLTGNFATDFTSLGCHSDLWSPRKNNFSNLVNKLKIQGKIPFPKKPNEIMGNLTEKVSQRIGLSRLPVSVGIHDSNASLVPHLLSQKSSFSVISTGTWVIVLSINGNKVELDQTRDTLLNVNLLGQETPSARFMGGREYEIEAGSGIPNQKDMRQMLKDNLILLPSIVNDVGPFQSCKQSWTPYMPRLGSGLRNLVVCCYLAMMTRECLNLVGHEGKIIVEGPFARNRQYINMLSVITKSEILLSKSITGTTIGAAMLFLKEDQKSNIKYDTVTHIDSELSNFARLWQQKIDLHRSNSVS